MTTDRPSEPGPAGPGLGKTSAGFDDCRSERVRVRYPRLMSDLTQLLDAAAAGDRRAAADLLPVVYNELRKLAAVRLSREAPGQTLDATGLVHEAYLRLVGDQQFENRGHFFAAAAEAMRRIVVETARRKKRGKHGGDWERVDIELADLPTSLPPDDLLALDEALCRLTQL